MFLLSTLAVLAAGAQLGQGLVVPAQPRDLDKRIPGTIPIQATTTNLWKFSHCQWDPTLGALTGYTFTSNSMTPDLCASTCASKGYKYAGVRDRNYCGCSSVFYGNGYPIDKANCQYYSCTGNTATACGGSFALGIYINDDDAVAASVSMSQSLSASQSASVAASVSASQSRSASISASAAASASLSQSISQSQSASLAASVAASAAASNSLAQSISQSQSLSASVSASVAASVAASAAASNSLAASISQSRSASVAASVAASAAASASLAQSISQSQSASVAASVAASAAASASLAQSISQSQSASLAASVSASASVAASVSASLSASAAAVQATQIPGQWVAQGSSAIAEGTSGRALTGASTSAADMTYFKCLSFCDSKNFAIAGLEYGSECYCGNALVNGASLSKTSSQGNMPCGGSASKICGGPDALTIFAIPSKISALSADLTAKSAALPSGWSAASTACVAEPQNGRALTGASTSANDMTPAKCSQYCADKGFKYAGVEYSSECYCGNSGDLLNTPSTQCNMACSGDINTICGGAGALNVFTNPSIVPSVGKTDKPVSSGALPTGWSAASTQCIQEVSGRALTGSSIAGNSMTIGTCLSFCQNGGFEYAGLEFGSECYCGGSLVNGASLDQTSGQCNMACASDSTSTCGGPNAIQLYRNPSNAKAAAPVTVVNGFSSTGCIQEVAGRALTGLRVDYADMTIEKCTAACSAAGFKLAGVEYGQECYCSNSLANGASLSLTSGQCNMNCPGNAGQTCGGPNAIQLYTLNN